MTGIQAIELEAYDGAPFDDVRLNVTAIIHQIMAGKAIAQVAFDACMEVRTVRLICAAYLQGRENSKT